MPTTSESLAAYMPRVQPVFQSNKHIVPVRAVKPMTVEQFAPFPVQPPPGTQSTTTPREIHTSVDDLAEIPKKKRNRMGLWLGCVGALALLIALVVGITVPLLFLRSSTTTSTTSALASSIVTTTTTTQTTTTVNCISPYVLAPSGSCVNVLIDINNCGSVGNNCSSNYSSCSAGVCSQAPGIQLVGSNFLWTAAVNGSVDDYFFPVTLPWNITLYSTTVSSVSVTTNGVFCFGACSTAYTETALPTGTFPGVTAFPYWDDLYIYASTSQGIYYASQGNAPNRTLTFEFYMSHYSQPNQYYHYQVLFFESRPNVVQYRYFDASDGGISCTVGVQASGTGPFIQYSFDVANSVRSNMSLTFDTTLGIYTNSTF